MGTFRYKQPIQSWFAQGRHGPQIAQISQAYNNWNVSPQPALGIAWNPKFDEGFLGKLMGGDKTVIRAGYSLRKFTEPQQYVWNQASDFASSTIKASP